MGAIRITQFSGIIPRTAEGLLPETAAQIAENCRLTDGELEPLYAAKTVYTTSKAGAQQTIFRISDGAAYAWLTWPYDVDVARSPITGVQRWVFTGDGEPRTLDLSLAVSGGGTAYPNQYYALGIPAPQTAPSVSPSGGSGAAVSRVYVYTFFSQWGEESAPSPANTLVSGKVDDTWAITGMDAFPANSGTVTGTFAAGVTTFDNTTNHWLRVGEEVVVGGVAMEVTEVPSSTTFKVAGDYSAATTWARKAPWNTTGMKRRLYRSAGTNATYQLVHDDVGTTYNDTLLDSAIMGDELISDTWDPPPVGLRGVFSLPSGALGGFVGNALRFSEPFQVHAWPVEYELSATNDIISAGSFGTGICAATTGAPFIVTGVDPASMSGFDWVEVLPCQSKRSLISLGDAVLYASHLGIISVGPSGANVWSEGFYTKQEWKTLSPNTMIAALHDRQVVFHYTDSFGTPGALVFNLQGATVLRTASFAASAMFVDVETGKLYYADGANVKEYDNEEEYVETLDWMSKEFILPKPMNLGAAKIEFDSAFDADQAALIEAEIAAIEASNAAMLAAGSVGGAWNASGYNTVAWNGSNLETPPSVPPGNAVSFSLYVDGELKFSRSVTTSRVFRLPSGYKADRVAVRVMAQSHIKSIVIGDTPKSLESA